MAVAFEATERYSNTMTSDSSISVVVTALNEQAHLEQAVVDIVESVQSRFAQYEVLVFNDGSTDGTGRMADQLAARHPAVSAFHNETPHNVGGVTREGFKKARMQYVIQVDGKGATTRESLDRIFSRTGEADVVIPYAVNQHQRPWPRRIVSWVYRNLLNLLFGLRLHYYGIGVLARADLVRQFDIRTDSYSFNAELIIKMIRGGCSYVEVAIEDRFDDTGRCSKAFRWRNIKGVVAFIFRTFWDVHFNRRQGGVAKRTQRVLPDKVPPASTSAHFKSLLEGRLNDTWEQMLRFPRYVNIEPVSGCNARCVMCGIDFSKRRGGPMSEELFDRLAAQLTAEAAHLRRVGLVVNCEPLLDAGLERKVAILKAGGIGEVFISTNASLLTPQRAESLLKAGLDKTYISIDGVDRQTYESIRRGLDFETVRQNILEFIRLRNAVRPQALIRVLMVLQERNRTQAGAFVDYWKPRLRPQDQIVVDCAYDWGKAQGVAMCSEVSAEPCLALWSTLDIFYDGEVGLCCIDLDKKVPLGNLNEQTIHDLWHGRQLARIRGEHLEGRRGDLPLCRRCAVWSDVKRLVAEKGAAAL